MILSCYEQRRNFLPVIADSRGAQFNDEVSVVNNNPNASEAGVEVNLSTQPQAGMISRLAGGVYSKTATVVGGVGWAAGSAVSSTYGIIKGAGGYVNIWKKKEKCKSE
eukprot:gene18246-20066_t